MPIRAMLKPAAHSRQDFFDANYDNLNKWIDPEKYKK